MTEDGITQLKNDEGFMSTPYNDSVGVLTIGYGTNLRQGITEEQADTLLRIEMKHICDTLTQYNWYNDLNETRKDVISNMAYNIGVYGVLKFHKMIAALTASNFIIAANEMLDSLWARQVGDRAKRLAKQMRIGIRE